jgi:translation initiation factor 3 subunit D
LSEYDRTADRVTPKMPTKVTRPHVLRRPPTASEDPILTRLAAEGAGDVFISDYLLSVLMTAPRSVLPWDVIISKKGEQLFFDFRRQSALEYLTSGETAPEPPVEDADALNGVHQLRLETTAVNQALKEQVLKSSMTRPVTNEEESQLASEPLPKELAESVGVPAPGYRYRRWQLGNTRLVVRCEIDGYVKAGNTAQYLAVHALNEFDPRWSGVDWSGSGDGTEKQRGENGEMDRCCSHWWY